MRRLACVTGLVVAREVAIRPEVKRWIALKLHGWAYQLAPELGVAVRNAVIQQLAAEHADAQRAQAARLIEHQQRVAQIARNQ